MSLYILSIVTHMCVIGRTWGVRQCEDRTIHFEGAGGERRVFPDTVQADVTERAAVIE
jgi:hypothetical protein